MLDIRLHTPNLLSSSESHSHLYWIRSDLTVKAFNSSGVDLLERRKEKDGWDTLNLIYELKLTDRCSRLYNHSCNHNSNNQSGARLNRRRPQDRDSNLTTK
jgi:hypothetical protein